MSKRCDQVIDCKVDDSDEMKCSLVVLPESYRKSVPPLSPTHRVDVEVMMMLLDVVAIRVAANEIELKFLVTFSWLERRAVFHNLKQKMNLNSLQSEVVEQLWIPKLIYSNTKQNENTHMSIKESTLTIIREGTFVRTTLETVDEIEIFRGDENPIEMHQDYTKTFQCTYNLENFPFDSQVFCLV